MSWGGKEELVKFIKEWQRTSPGHKESWYNFVYSELGCTDYDPNRHEADVLQSFVDRANAGEIDLEAAAAKGKGRKGSSSGGNNAMGWDAVAQMGKGKGLDPMMMMNMMNQMCQTMGSSMGGMSGGMGMGGMSRGGKGKSNAKPGDWICPGCGDLVFARKDACSMCGTSKDQAGGSDGGGGCSAMMSGMMAGMMGGSMGGCSGCGGKGGAGRPGDWHCTSCGNLNFSSRSECKSCEAPIGNAKRMGMKSGDWICPNCGDLVFASKSACKMCGHQKPWDSRPSPY